MNPTLNDMRIGHLEYNGFVFPTLSKIEAHHKPVYDDAGLVVKYQELHLKVAFPYYPTSEEIGGVTSANYDSLRNNNTLQDKMSDLSRALRQRLLQPGQPFKMHSFGNGRIEINTTSFGSDKNFGPKPIDCTWAPLAGNIIAWFEWECIVHLDSPCATLTAGNILALNYTTQWDFDEDNSSLMTRSIDGHVELAMSRTPNPSSSQANKKLPSLDTALSTAESEILRLFPKPKGFRRKKTFRLSADFKRIDFGIVDKEIMSDVPLPAPILDLDLDHEVESDIEQAFKIWKVSFTGTVRVNKSRVNTTGFGRQKALAWVAIGILIKKRLDLAKTRTISSNGVEQAGKIIIDRIRIKDSVNKNSFNFNLQYRLWSSPANIFNQSGLFKPLKIDGDTWQKQDTFFQQTKSDGSPFIPWPVDQPLLYEQCGPQSTQFGEQRSIVTADVPATVTFNDYPYQTNPTGDNYLKYRNDYELSDYNSSSVHLPLFDSAEGRWESPRTTDIEGLSPVSQEHSQLQSGAPVPLVHNPTARTFLITQRGFAVRSGAPATPPNLVLYGGNQVAKIGVDRINVRELVVGVALNPNQSTTTIYRTDWVKTYIVRGALTPETVAKRDMDKNAGNPARTGSTTIV